MWSPLSLYSRACRQSSQAVVATGSGQKKKKQTNKQKNVVWCGAVRCGVNGIQWTSSIVYRVLYYHQTVTNVNVGGRVPLPPTHTHPCHFGACDEVVPHPSPGLSIHTTFTPHLHSVLVHKRPRAHSLFTPHSHHIYIVYWYTKHPGAHSLFTPQLSLNSSVLSRSPPMKSACSPHSSLKLSENVLCEWTTDLTPAAASTAASSGANMGS